MQNFFLPIIAALSISGSAFVGEVASTRLAIPHVLYPGDPACNGTGCEGPLRDPLIFIPNRNGSPWGNTYLLGEDDQKHLAGYSSGRIALLRRLALRNDGEWAILLDPSWNDGKRDFLSDGFPVTGDALVKKWLQGNKDRNFLLIYSSSSVGWSNYAALINDTIVGGQVKVCFVSVSHLNVPAAVGPLAILDPEGFDNGTCRRK